MALREAYKEGFLFLQAKGFKKIDFWGISPGYFYKKNTTIFYKADNCIGIEGIAREQNYQYDAGILFLFGLSHEEHSDSMRRLREFK